jgi:hypothetical protein
MSQLLSKCLVNGPDADVTIVSGLCSPSRGCQRTCPVLWLQFGAQAGVPGLHLPCPPQHPPSSSLNRRQWPLIDDLLSAVGTVSHSVKVTVSLLKFHRQTPGLFLSCELSQISQTWSHEFGVRAVNLPPGKPVMTPFPPAHLMGTLGGSVCLEAT